jgi:LmbE family N-acetylglucosaminyl deacetylase
MKRVLVVATHPDDETLGCGGAILKHKRAGDQVHWLVVTSPRPSAKYDDAYFKKRTKQIEEVQRLYGVDSITHFELPALELDRLPMADVVAAFSKQLQDLRPEVAYIPFYGDAHTDHQVVNKAFLSAAKTFRSPFLKRILMMETISETEFALQTAGNAFLPQCFCDISEFLDHKVKAMKIYSDEVGAHPFPRSLDNIRALAHYRGAMAGVAHAEAFMLARESF